MSKKYKIKKSIRDLQKQNIKLILERDKLQNKLNRYGCGTQYRNGRRVADYSRYYEVGTRVRTADIPQLTYLESRLSLIASQIDCNEAKINVYLELLKHY